MNKLFAIAKLYSIFIDVCVVLVQACLTALQQQQTKKEPNQDNNHYN